MGQRGAISPLDIKKINKIYNCETKNSSYKRNGFSLNV